MGGEFAVAARHVALVQEANWEWLLARCGGGIERDAWKEHQVGALSWPLVGGSLVLGLGARTEEFEVERGWMLLWRFLGT